MRALEEEFEKCRAVPAMCRIPVITGCRDIPFFTPISLGEDDDDHRTLFLTMLCAFHALLPLPRRRYHTRTSTNLILCFTVNDLATVITPYSCCNKLQTLDYGTAAQPFVHFTRTPHPNNAKSPKAYTHMHTAHPPTLYLHACFYFTSLHSPPPPPPPPHPRSQHSSTFCRIGEFKRGLDVKTWGPMILYQWHP